MIRRPRLEETVILESLHAALAAAPTAPASLGWDRASMAALSRAIEAESIASPGAVLFALFQRERALRTALPRYLALAPHLRHLYLAADAIPAELARLPNVTAVSLGPADPWLDEWALVLLTPESGAVLSAVARDGHAEYSGFWSCDPRLLQAARGALPDMLAARGIGPVRVPAPCHAPGAQVWQAGERLARRMIESLQRTLVAQRRPVREQHLPANTPWDAAALAGTVLEQLRQSVIACDLAGRVRYWNHVAAETFGWSAAEICGQTLARVFPGTPGVDPAALLTEIHARGAITGVWRGHHRNGEPRLLSVRTVPLCAADGTAIGLLGIGNQLAAAARPRPRSLRATA